LKDRNPNKSIKSEWSINASDRSWILAIKGSVGDQGYQYTVSGFLWGEEREDWLITYAGLGSTAERIFITGKALWKYDPKLSDHTTMSFEQVVKFGENSVWGWVRGSELVVGGTIGAAGGVIVAVGTPAAVILGVGGAIAGAGSAATLSDVAKEFLESHEPPPPPIAPKLPNIPKNDEKITPRKGQIAISVSQEVVFGHGPTEGLYIDGSFKGGAGTGVILER
jgi:hypothetical protein